MKETTPQPIAENRVPTLAEWREHKELVLYRLDEISATLKEVSEKQDAIAKRQYLHDKKISMIEFKSGFFGTIGGTLGVVVVFGIEWAKGLLSK